MGKCRVGQLQLLEAHSQTLAYISEVMVNYKGENDNEMRNVSQVTRPENWQKYVQTD